MRKSLKLQVLISPVSICGLGEGGRKKGLPEDLLLGVLVYKGISPTYESLSSIGK